MNLLCLDNEPFFKIRKRHMNTSMDLTKYRKRPEEQDRIEDLMRIVPKGRVSVLDIGARDGYISKKLTDHFSKVTALDLEKPKFQIKNVITVSGDVTRLDLADSSFDVVLCAEVLEHIPPTHLLKACNEIKRVAKYEVVIGVPYQQDLRLGRTTCLSCGQINPPWGHVNCFDKIRLRQLFEGMNPIVTSFVGEKMDRTNAISTLLMDLAENPWGTYNQEETCTHCGQMLKPPSERTMLQRVFSAAAHSLNSIQKPFVSSTPRWIHIVFKRPSITW